MAFSSKNAFALLGDEDTPVAAAPATKATETKAPAPSARSIPGSGRGAPRGAANNRAPRRQAGDSSAAAAGEDGAPQTRELRERKPREGGRGRGRGGARGGRGRAFDRHSQTDRVDSEKNLHQGWGGDDGKRELKAEQDGVEDAAAEKPTVEANGEGAATPAAAETPAEEVDNTQTLDEYLASLAAKKANLGGKTVAPRTLESDDQWNNFGSKVVKSQGGGDEYYASTKTNAQRQQKERKERQTLEIEQTFNTPPVASRGGRGRGGPREGGRGRGEGRGRGGARGGRGRGGAGANVNLDDKRAFPTLS
ncbi:unnamed protein product [Sympodiomycopsis kandeliae]